MADSEVTDESPQRQGASGPGVHGKRPSLQHIARRWMHDRVCASENCNADDHAKRTQSVFGTAAVRAWRQGSGLRHVIHEHACLGCPHPIAHEIDLTPLAFDLSVRLAARGS